VEANDELTRDVFIRDQDDNIRVREVDPETGVEYTQTVRRDKETGEIVERVGSPRITKILPPQKWIFERRQAEAHLRDLSREYEKRGYTIPLTEKNIQWAIRDLKGEIIREEDPPDLEPIEPIELTPKERKGFLEGLKKSVIDRIRGLVD